MSRNYHKRIRDNMQRYAEEENELNEKSLPGHRPEDSAKKANRSGKCLKRMQRRSLLVNNS